MKPAPRAFVRDPAVAAMDPGFEGAVSVLGLDGKLLERHVWPTFEVKKGKKNRTEYDEAGVRDILEGIASRYDAFFVIEKQNPMKGQGVTSMFTTGGGYYMLRMALVCIRARWTAITPQSWQKVMFDGMAKPPPRIAKKGKNAGQPVKTKASKVLSPLLCSRLWPGDKLLATPRSTKPHDGLADSMVMAEFSRRSNFHPASTAPARVLTEDDEEEA